MRQVLPSRLRHRADALRFTTIPTRPGDAAVEAVSPDVLIALSSAIRSRETLRFDYASRDPDVDSSGPAPRRVEPHHLVASGGRWYLVAWDLERDDWRLYSAGRITPRTPTGPRFAPREVPGGDVREFVAARFKGSNENAWPCIGTVILDLPAAAVLPFAGDGTVAALDDGRCSLELGSWSWGSLAANLGRFEVAMEVVQPPELRDAFAVLAARYASAAR